MARERSKGKSCCLSILLTVVIVVAIIAIGVVILLNLTPNKVKLGDKTIYEDNTLNSIGLGDTKFKDIIKGISEITNVPKEEELVKYPYDQETEKKVANKLLEVPEDFDYSRLLTEKVSYSYQKLISYNNTTLAYIFNEVVQSAPDGDLALLKNAGVTINEISFSLDSSGEFAKLKIIGSFAVPDALKPLPDGVLKMPEKIYMVSNLTFTVNGDGIIETTPDSIALNSDKETAVSKALISLITNKVVEQTGVEEEKAKDGADILNESLGKGFSTVIKSLGLVASSGSIFSSGSIDSPIYGISGVSNNIITVVTYKK